MIGAVKVRSRRSEAARGLYKYVGRWGEVCEGLVDQKVGHESIVCDRCLLSQLLYGVFL